MGRTAEVRKHKFERAGRRLGFFRVDRIGGHAL